MTGSSEWSVGKMWGTATGSDQLFTFGVIPPADDRTMRFRIEIRRVQVVERWVRAADEESALAKIRADAADPWGLFGSWKTAEMHAEVLETENISGVTTTGLDDGPMLLSVPDAAVQLGISQATLYILLRTGEIERVNIGRRTLISRDALRDFIRANSARGYHVE